MGKNSINLSQKELGDIEYVWEFIKVFADSLLKEYKWSNSQMANCLRNLADTYE